jgi:hypothetical protein
MAKDIKLDPATHDLIVEGFDFQLVDEADRVRQQVAIRLQFFLGEWFLDLDFGFPWFQEVLGVKPPPLARVEALIREQVLTTPDVQELEALELDYVGAARTLTVNLRVKTTFGSVDVEVSIP